MDRDFFLALLRLVIFLPLVAGLGYLAVRYGLGSRATASRGQGRLEVLERLTLSPKHGLAIVRAGERCFLLGLGEGSPALLTELGHAGEANLSAGDVQVYDLPAAPAAGLRPDRLGKGLEAC